MAHPHLLRVSWRVKRANSYHTLCMIPTWYQIMPRHIMSFLKTILFTQGQVGHPHLPMPRHAQHTHGLGCMVGWECEGMRECEWRGWSGWWGCECGGVRCICVMSEWLVRWVCEGGGMCEGIKSRKRRWTKGYHQGDCQCLVKLALFLGPTHLRKKGLVSTVCVCT